MAAYYRQGGFFSSLPTATKNILIINVFVLIFTKLSPAFMNSWFALYYPTSPHFHIWQPFTYMFMHGGFLHLFLNMFALVMFGSMLENQWGTRKFLLYYFVTGLGAAAVHLGVEWVRLASGAAPYIINIPTVGASGAIYGLLLGYAMLFPDSRLTLIFPPITLSAKWWVIVWFVIELLSGISGGGGIAHFAHLGGMIFGFILIKYWKSKGKMYDYE